MTISREAQGALPSWELLLRNSDQLSENGSGVASQTVAVSRRLLTNRFAAGEETRRLAVAAVELDNR